MRNLMFACTILVVASGCHKDSGNPMSSSPTDLSNTPSLSAPILKIEILKVGTDEEGLPVVTIKFAENLNAGLASNMGVTAENGWNGATIDLITKCDGHDSKVELVYNYSTDPQTGKNTVVFEREWGMWCHDKIYFRVLAITMDGVRRDFTFPNASTQLVLQAGFSLVPDGGYVYISGTPR